MIAAAVVEGRLHLTAIVRLAPHLKDENVDQLVAEASGKSKAEIDVLLARLAPKPDVAARLERVVGQEVLVPEPPDAEVVAEPPGRAGSTGRVAALAPLQVTIGEATQRKLVRAQALLRHRMPSGAATWWRRQGGAGDGRRPRRRPSPHGRDGERRQAVAASPRSGTAEERIRAALGALRAIYASRGGTRCAEPLAAWH